MMSTVSLSIPWRSLILSEVASADPKTVFLLGVVDIILEEVQSSDICILGRMSSSMSSKMFQFGCTSSRMISTTPS